MNTQPQLLQIPLDPGDVVYGDNYTLIRGDCLEVLPMLAAGSVDAAITDIPYFNVLPDAWDKQWKTIQDFQSWVNMWATGQNAVLGWRGVQSGRGARSLGQLLGNTQAFSQCMAEKVFELVCQKPAEVQTDKDQVKNLAVIFEQNGRYSMKDLVAKTSVLCLGE